MGVSSVLISETKYGRVRQLLLRILEKCPGTLVIIGMDQRQGRGGVRAFLVANLLFPSFVGVDHLFSLNDGNSRGEMVNQLCQEWMVDEVGHEIIVSVCCYMTDWSAKLF